MDSRFGPVLLEGAARVVVEHAHATPPTLDAAIATVAALWRPASRDVQTGTFDAWGEPVGDALLTGAVGPWTEQTLALLPTRAGAFRLVVPSGGTLPDVIAIIDADGVERSAAHRDGWVTLAQAATSLEVQRSGPRSARLVLMVGVPWWVGGWDPRPDTTPRFGVPISAWRTANRAAFDSMLQALRDAGWR